MPCDGSATLEPKDQRLKATPLGGRRVTDRSDATTLPHPPAASRWRSRRRQRRRGRRRSGTHGTAQAWSALPDHPLSRFDDRSPRGASENVLAARGGPTSDELESLLAQHHRHRPLPAVRLRHRPGDEVPRPDEVLEGERSRNVLLRTPEDSIDVRLTDADPRVRVLAGRLIDRIQNGPNVRVPLSAHGSSVGSARAA